MMNKVAFTPINIIWIEDNPLLNGKKCGTFLNEEGERVFSAALDNRLVPAINLSGELVGYEKYFNLRVLQHPEEIKEYYSMTLLIEEKYGSSGLSSVDGVVPEIVVFDYKLSENLTINQAGPAVFSMSYIKPTEEIRRFVNPNFALRARLDQEINGLELHLEDSGNIGYSDDDFIKRVYDSDTLSEGELKQIHVKMGDDEFGLFAGIEIVRHFRQHACIGIPATANKADRKRLHPLSRYYEWFNEKDLSTALDRKGRDDKTWNTILKDGALQLRTQIISQVRSGKITPSYCELNELSNLNFVRDKFFSFSSIYGERRLPLDGLFIDQPSEKRAESVREWTKDIINNLSNNGSDIEKAKAVSETLWATYTKDFEDRILLSDYSLRKDSLNIAEKNSFDDIKRTYCNQTERISKEMEVSIDTLLTSKDKTGTKRLAVLLTVAKAWIQLEKCRTNAAPKKEYSQIGKEEYIYMLFPISNTKEGLLLPMHKEKGKDLDTFEKSIFRKLTSPERPITTATWDLFQEWITPCEKQMIISIYFSEKEFLPRWLLELP